MRARQRAGVVNGVKLDRGQLVLGEDEIGGVCGLTRKQVRARLGRLQKLGELDIKADNHGSTVTVVNYGSYVADLTVNGQHKGQQRASKGPAKGQKQKEQEEEKIDTANSGGPRDAYLDCMQVLWTEYWPQVCDPPYSLWGKWQKEYGPDAVLAMAKRVGLSGKQFESKERLVAYLNAALANQARDSDRQSPQRMPFVIATALGEPITDPDERLMRIRESGFDADPDHDHWFTIPDHVVRAEEIDEDTRQAILGRLPHKEPQKEALR
ncbi:MAG: hypothetical protein O3A47_08560 [Chloroflexi bacterium]|nr:hypothetical protein [Chloroflexota bacterium]